MAEKGGKGLPLSNSGGRKSSLKTSGKGEGSPKLNSNFSSKSGGKVSFETPLGKGDLGKGGKGDKTGKAGGKSSVSEEPVIPEFKIEEELPKNSKCIMDCEAAVILQGIQEQVVILSEDPTIKMPESFDRGLLYAKAGSHYTSPQSVGRILESLKKIGVSDGEICLIANTCPETVDEAFALIPSLKANRRKMKEPIKNALYELAKIKQFK